MQDKIFRTFREAADYARQESEKNGVTMNVVRTGDSWKVARGSSLQSESHLHKNSDAHAWHKRPNQAEAFGRRVPEGAHYSWEIGGYVSDEIQRVSIQR